jgi:exodeoxyribonuclease V alpha subunit
MNASLKNANRLTLTVVSVKYESAAFTIFEGMPKTEKQSVTVTTSQSVKPGSKVVVDGRFINHPKFGRQFKATTLVAYLPDSKEELIAYFQSGGVPGIGKLLALELIKAFGDDTITVIEEEPWRLRAIKGIGTDRAASIKAVIAKERSYAKLLKFIEPYDVELSQAALIHHHFGMNSVDVTKAPWKLREVKGVTNETIRQLSKGVSGNDEQLQKDQVTAHLNRMLALGGHTSILLSDLHAAVEKEMKTFADSTMSGSDLNALLPGTAVTYDYAGESYVTTEQCFKRDKWIADQITYRQSRPRRVSFVADADILSTLVPEQRVAYQALCENPDTLLVGSSGTGKTTVLKAFVQTVLLQDSNLKVSLCAPTGKAASRLSDGIGLPALTIHRLLGSKGPNGWTYHHKNKLDCDLLVIDELSMLDAFLFAAILSALPPECILLMAGDRDQLNSVGPGAIIRDLLDSHCLPVAGLYEPIPFDPRSPITQTAREALQALPLSLPYADEANPEASFQISVETDNEVSEKVYGVLSSLTIPDRLKTRIMSPFKNGPLGSQALNKKIHHLMNPALSNSIKRPKRFGAFYEKDRVIQTRNSHELGVFNGQVGYIKTVHPDQTCDIAFGAHAVLFTESDLKYLELAYATTIHKMLGGEADNVVVILPSDPKGFVSRQMLNTAVTRARTRLIVIVVKEAFTLAANIDASDKCCTALSHLLNGQFAHEAGEGLVNTEVNRY